MRVLVVEGSVSQADVIAKGLRLQGIAVDVAYDGDDAARKLALTDYHVVVLERSVPGRAGDDLCQQITTGESRAMVLMLSGAASPEERISGLELGADDYVGKPFHLRELVLRVQALARRQPEACPQVLRRADIELLPLQRTARRGQRVLDLTAKEFGVLEALMRTGTVLSSEDLLEQVWDEHANPFTDVVRPVICRLRHKLGTPPVIETVPRAGYRLSNGTIDEPEPDPPSKTALERTVCVDARSACSCSGRLLTIGGGWHRTA